MQKESPDKGMSKIQLIEEIEKLRKEINDRIITAKTDNAKMELIQLSKRLDKLLNDYYKLK